MELLNIHLRFLLDLGFTPVHSYTSDVYYRMGAKSRVVHTYIIPYNIAYEDSVILSKF